MEKNRQIVLASRPQGVPSLSNFQLVESVLPELQERQFLVELEYLSVDPYMRGLLRAGGSYAEPVVIGQLMPGAGVGTVRTSRHGDFQPGQVVVGPFGWQELAISEGRGVQRFDTALAPVSTALGILGMPGMTAYFGLFDIGQPRAGETVLVSAAAGAVGSTVCQLAKLQGCRVVGSAGSANKVDYLLSELGIDAAFNYKQVDNYAAKLHDLCPEGIDVYFDNVGGPLSDAVFPQLNHRGRVVVCGQIDQYNTEEATGPRVLWYLITRRARAEGLLVHDFAHRFPEALARMAPWIRDGKLRYRETITDGLENTPQAFIGLFSGENLGKQLVRLRRA